MKESFKPLYYVLFSAVLIIVINIIFRPLLPVDETRYVAVAWEMWYNKTWLVPTLNGEFYSHKPPLLFWILNAGWGIFGVEDFITRMIIPLVSVLNFVLLWNLSKKLFPANNYIRDYSPFVLLSMLAWVLYTPMLMFDQLITIFVLLHANLIYDFATTKNKWYLILSGLAIGGGFLTKGPVILIYSIVWTALYPLWRPEKKYPNKKFYFLASLSFLIGIMVILLWAIPAAIKGGEEYTNAIFVKQSVDRMHASFQHRRPFYWYLILLPLLTLPWIFFKEIWNKKNWINKWTNVEKALTLWFVLTLIIFSFISGKQIHYLLPVFPALALVLSSRLKPWQFKSATVLAVFLGIIGIVMLTSPLWVDRIFRVTTGRTPYFLIGLIPLLFSFVLWRKKIFQPKKAWMILLFIPFTLQSVIAVLNPCISDVYSTERSGLKIKEYQDKGYEVGFLGKYHGQYNYPGRLEKPVKVFQDPDSKTELMTWLNETPKNLITLNVKKPTTQMLDLALYSNPFRGRYYLIFDKEGFIKFDELLKESKK